MAAREGLTASEGTPAHRNAEEIRLDIVAERQVLADTVDQLGVRIQEKLEWRSYVKRSPYLALGAAAGVGLMASAMFKKTSPLERLLNNAAKPLSKAQNKGAAKSILFSIATKAATAWLAKAVSEAVDKRGPIVRSSSPTG